MSDFHLKWSNIHKGKPRTNVKILNKKGGNDETKAHKNKTSAVIGLMIPQKVGLLYKVSSQNLPFSVLNGVIFSLIKKTLQNSAEIIPPR